MPLPTLLHFPPADSHSVNCRTMPPTVLLPVYWPPLASVRQTNFLPATASSVASVSGLSLVVKPAFASGLLSPNAGYHSKFSIAPEATTVHFELVYFVPPPSLVFRQRPNSGASADALAANAPITKATVMQRLMIRTRLIIPPLMPASVRQMEGA